VANILRNRATVVSAKICEGEGIGGDRQTGRELATPCVRDALRGITDLQGTWKKEIKIEPRTLGTGSIWIAGRRSGRATRPRHDLGLVGKQRGGFRARSK
jgi:hypothetical protein